MTRRIPSRGSDQFNLRFPEGMREKMKIRSDKNGRSMNAEIISILEDAIKRDEESISSAPSVFFNTNDLRDQFSKAVREAVDNVFKGQNVKIIFTPEIGERDASKPPSQSQKQGDDTPE